MKMQIHSFKSRKNKRDKGYRRARWRINTDMNLTTKVVSGINKGYGITATRHSFFLMVEENTTNEVYVRNPDDGR